MTYPNDDRGLLILLCQALKYVENRLQDMPLDHNTLYWINRRIIEHMEGR